MSNVYQPVAIRGEALARDPGEHELINDLRYVQAIRLERRGYALQRQQSSEEWRRERDSNPR